MASLAGVQVMDRAVQSCQYSNKLAGYRSPSRWKLALPACFSYSVLADNIYETLNA